jgi:hypothetical protein
MKKRRELRRQSVQQDKTGGAWLVHYLFSSAS